MILDGNSTDGTNDKDNLKKHGVNTLLVKIGKGKQGAQLRMGFHWAIERGYDGIITIDGNNKDGIEDTNRFIEKLDEGYDFVQGSRFIKGGIEENTPKSRGLAVRLIHAPIISLTAHKRYTDTTNNFRAYSMRYIKDERVDVFRDIFNSYELLAYLSVRASQLKMKTCEAPVARRYPKDGKVPTKISPLKGNLLLIKILFANFFGFYLPPKQAQKCTIIYSSIIGFVWLALTLCVGVCVTKINNPKTMVVLVAFISCTLVFLSIIEILLVERLKHEKD